MKTNLRVSETPDCRISSGGSGLSALLILYTLPSKWRVFFFHEEVVPSFLRLYPNPFQFFQIRGLFLGSSR